MRKEDLLALHGQTEQGAKQLARQLSQTDEEIAGLQGQRDQMERQLIFLNGRLSMLQELLEDEKEEVENESNDED